MSRAGGSPPPGRPALEASPRDRGHPVDEPPQRREEAAGPAGTGPRDALSGVGRPAAAVAAGPPRHHCLQGASPGGSSCRPTIIIAGRGGRRRPARAGPRGPFGSCIRIARGSGLGGAHLPPDPLRGAHAGGYGRGPAPHAEALSGESSPPRGAASSGDPGGPHDRHERRDRRGRSGLSECDRAILVPFLPLPLSRSSGEPAPLRAALRPRPDTPGRGRRATADLGSGPRIRLDPGERDVEAAFLRQVPAVRGPVFTSKWGIHQLSGGRGHGFGPGFGCQASMLI
jgi:hypothetical protein